jgi:hypothetical protein
VYSMMHVHMKTLKCVARSAGLGEARVIVDKESRVDDAAF